MCDAPIRRSTSVLDAAYKKTEDPGFWTTRAARKLQDAGFKTLGDIADAEWGKLATVATSSQCREGLKIVRNHIHHRDAEVGARLPLDDDIPSSDAVIDDDDENDPYGIAAMGVWLTPSQVENLERILRNSSDRDAASIKSAIEPYAERARASRRDDLDPQADAVIWTSNEGGYRVRVGIWNPDHMDPTVRVYHRWDTELWGMAITIIMSSLRKSATRYLVFKDLDRDNGRLLAETNKLKIAKRVAYYKARAHLPIVVPPSMPVHSEVERPQQVLSGNRAV